MLFINIVTLSIIAAVSAQPRPAPVTLVPSAIAAPIENGAAQATAVAGAIASGVIGEGFTLGAEGVKAAGQNLAPFLPFGGAINTEVADLVDAATKVFENGNVAGEVVDQFAKGVDNVGHIFTIPGIPNILDAARPTGN